MYGKYFKLTLRNLKRNKTYSILNVLGLTVGIVVSIFIFIYVRDELNFDKFYEDADRIYRIVNRATIRGGPIEMPSVSGPWGPAMADEFPEVLKAVRIKVPESRWTLRYADLKYFEKGLYFADQTFLDVFDVELIAGDPETALAAPYSLVLTEEMAGKYFRDDDPLGKIIQADIWLQLTVTGVMKKHPVSTHMDYDFLVNFETLLTAKEPPGRLAYGDLSRWSNFRILTYLLLEENTEPETIEEKMPAFLGRHLGQLARTPGVEFSPYLQKISDIHLKSHLEGEIGPNSNESYIYIFSAVAVFILMIASINFMNLATAWAANRAKEVGMRKVVGAARSQLIKQFLTESVLMTFLAAALAVTVVLLLLSEFNALTGKHVSMSAIFHAPILLALAGLPLLLGLISGSYPAFFLTAFRPVDVLSGKLRLRSSGGLLRKVLVVVQFAISVFLIVGLSVISTQMTYIRNRNLGFDKEHIIAVPLSDYYVRNNYEPYKNILLSHRNILSVSGASSIPGGIFDFGLFWPSGRTFNDALTVQMLYVDYDFLETFGMSLLEGRDFAKEFPADLNRALLLNEEARKRFEFDTPQGNVLFPGKRQVVGTVKDFFFKSLHQEIEPFALQLVSPDGFYWAFIKVLGENIQESLDFAEAEWEKANPTHPFEYTFVDENYDLLYRSEMKLSRLSGIFTGIAVFVACLGLFGLSSFMALQKTKEIGIRKVLGASIGNIVYRLVHEFVGLVVIAALIACPLAYFVLNKWLANFAYRINIGIGILLSASAMALIIALLTVSYQSIKAAAANPIDSLRYE
jgi:putative ABC transport system permease protein